jgi:hypothetical protein
MAHIPEFEIYDIEETDPLRIVIQLDKRLRPRVYEGNDYPDLDEVRSYCSTLRYACELFGVKFEVPEAGDDDTKTIRAIFSLTKAEIEKKKLELLYKKINPPGSVALDPPWRDKIHSYLVIVRQIVERAELAVPLRESIMAKLNSLAAEIDRSRTRIEAFTDVLITLCEGIGEGAEALKPAVHLFERVIGAIGRLKSKSPVLALPSPESFGLDAAEGAVDPDQASNL